MTHTDHETLRKELPLLASGDLPPERAAEVRAHLQGCGTCRAAYDGLRRTLSLLHEAGDAGEAPDLGTFYEDRLAPAVGRGVGREMQAKRRGGRRSPARGRSRFVVRPSRLVAHAAALLLAFAAGFATKAFFESSADAPSATTAEQDRTEQQGRTPVAANRVEAHRSRLERAYRRGVGQSDELSRALIGLAALQEGKPQ